MTRQHIQGNAWGSTGGGITDPGAAKVLLGYIKEKPPYQTENFKANRADEMLAHIEEYGIPVWDALTTYNINSYSLGSDGLIYKSQLAGANINNDPTTDPGTNWKIAFVDLTTAQTIAGIKTINSLKLGGNQDANNNKITLLATPTSNQDAANKAYVDGISKFAVNSTTSNISGSNNNAQTSPFIQTDGTEVVTVTLAGLTIGDVIEVNALLVGSSNSSPYQGALFADAVSASLSVAGNDSDGALAGSVSVSLLAYFTATSTSHTFKLRMSAESGTYIANTAFGGTSKCWISAKKVGV